MSAWINLDDTVPTLEGYYWCVIKGDSEIMDGYTLYEYPDYITLIAFFPASEERNHNIWVGANAEDVTEIICWWDERIVRPEMPRWEGE